MSKNNQAFFMAIAATTMVLLANSVDAQECGSCAQGQPVIQSFGYPAGGVVSDGCETSGCQTGGCFNGEFKARRQEAKNRNALAMARSNAYPKPWNCMDRQLYFSMWESMIDRGFERQCVLSADHFNAETNELNRFGQHTIAGIMQNMPDARKQVFVNRTSDENVNRQRLANVQRTVETFYGNLLADGKARIAYSNHLPENIRGQRALNIDAKATDGMQTPIIPISSGQGVAASVGGG